MCSFICPSLPRPAGSRSPTRTRTIRGRWKGERPARGIFHEQRGSPRDTFSREIRQVLLTHVNRLNADKLPDLLAILRKRGYRFVTLEEALEDDAYHTPDTFVGRNGSTTAAARPTA
jgi:hypothetical protein